jgi:hypothetical protein
MFLILGSGISGLLLAQRCRELGKPFLILGDKLLDIRNASGFFYAHEQTPLTEPESLPIFNSVCPGGSEDLYAKKVYGFKPASKLSWSKFAVNGKTGEAWFYNTEKLLEGIITSGEDANFLKTKAVRIWRSHVSTDRGHYFDRGYFSRILSTLPMPVLFELLGMAEESWFDNQKPIWIERAYESAAADSVRGVFVHYCAGSCHPWYRKTYINNGPPSSFGHSVETRYEYADEAAVQDRPAITLRPGKIWYEDESDEERAQKALKNLLSESIFCVGRYASWIPKMLTSDVWRESMRLKFL